MVFRVLKCRVFIPGKLLALLGLALNYLGLQPRLGNVRALTWWTRLSLVLDTDILKVSWGHMSLAEYTDIHVSAPISPT